MARKKLTFEDIRLMKLSKRLDKIYAEAEEGLTEKVNSFFAKFEELDKKKKALVDAKKLTQKEYDEWRKNKLLMGDKYKDLRDSIAERVSDTNAIATQYMNGELPKVYAHNFNDAGTNIQRQVKGYSFDLVNETTIRKLSTSKKTLLPYRKHDGRKDVRWNTKKVNSQILQGILQGESAEQMKQRLMKVTTMNKESALRNARTAVTSAQNKGRLDAMGKAEEDGVIMGKEWISAKDERTREWHSDLDRVVVPIDEPFIAHISYGKKVIRSFDDPIMYPGDPNADPCNTYNCRCAIAEVVLGFKKKGDDE